MKYSDWMHRTRAGALHPRSGRLRAVDAALRAAESAPSKDTLGRLRDALDQWFKTGSGFSSVRNHSGAVTALDRWVNQQLAALDKPAKAAPRIDPLKPMSPPPPLIPPAPLLKPMPAAKASTLPKLKTVDVLPDVGGGSDVASLAAKRARQREDQQWETVSVDGEQTITYPPGSQRNVMKADGSWELETLTVATAQSFPLEVRLKMRLVGTVLQVKAQAHIRPKVYKEGTPEEYTATIPPTMQIEFRTHIRSAWNVGTLIDGDRHFPIDFDIEWVDAGGYHLLIANPPPKPAAPTRIGPATLKQVQDKRAAETARLSENTINMAEWAWSDRQAMLHEFGHMIGNPDEYSVTSFSNLGQTWDNAVHNAPSFTTNSLMNDTSHKGRVHARHFSFVLQEYVAWQTRLGHTPAAKVVIETNPEVERLRKLAKLGAYKFGSGFQPWSTL